MVSSVLGAPAGGSVDNNFYPTFRWSYYAGAQARNLLEHGELAEMPDEDPAPFARAHIAKA